MKLPLTVGHEFAGKIVKIGKQVTQVKVGDIISAETHIICGTCEFCLQRRRPHLRKHQNHRRRYRRLLRQLHQNARSQLLR
ncbi:MAG: alcohol dehydrogenase catalytic domain-containing protein [Bacillus subtilis]|nr:alcohol dehydrogenase catalytic domain-containing protein [Bacillus subtilis]